ncbi:MAG: hypothetical protein WBF39_11690, partial [Planococcus donghaensis]
VVRYDYQGSEMTQTGNVETSFSIIDADENKISIQPFKVKITTNLRDGVIDLVNPEYGKLQEYVVELETLITNNENATIAANTAAEYATEQGDYALEIADANKNVLLSPVANFAALATTYPTPVFGSKAQTTDTGKIYRFDGTVWKYVEEMNSNMLTDIQNKLSIGIIEIKATTPTGAATFWLDTSFE